MNLDVGFEMTAVIDVEYGPRRLAVAEWSGKCPADVDPADVTDYEKYVVLEENR